MAKLLMMLATVLVFAGPAQAQESEIRGVIGGQIEAFQADDFNRAFTFASPMIQSIFRTPENFGRMVTQGYPMVWRPAEVRYLDLEDSAGILTQRVMITDRAGRLHLLEYRMIETPDGWKINGVSILEAAGVAA